MERLTREGGKDRSEVYQGGGKKKRGMGGGVKSNPPESAKSRTLKNWWQGGQATARATKIGKVNETEESI